QTQCGTGFVSQTTTDDQWDTAAGAYFIQQNVGFELEFANQFIGAMTQDLAFVRVNVDDITGVHFFYVTFDWQCAGIFHGVEEDRSDLATDAHATSAFVRDVGDIVADIPQYGVGRGLTGRTGTYHVTNQRYRVAFFLQFFNLCCCVGYAFTWHLVHGQCVQRDVRTGPGIRSRGQIVGVGFARNLEYAQGHFLRQFRTGQEPLGISPGLHQG